MYLKNYRDFLTTFSIQDSIDNQEIFNLVKIVEEDNSGQKKEDNMNLQEFVLMLIGAMDIKSIGKYDLAFEAIGKENIYLEDLFYIEKTLTFKSEIAEMKIEEKFKNHRYKKEYLNKSYGTK